jgi:hypothetical protein
MLISTDANAAQVVQAGEDPRFYDDLGCLAKDRAAHAPAARRYVRVGGGWLAAENAVYVSDRDARTPMGYNFVARPSAEAEGLSWTEFVKRMEQP